MTDWADEIAKKLVYMTNTSSERGIERANNRLANALRKARSDALEEAADRMDQVIRPKFGYVIRALKDRQP